MTDRIELSSGGHPKGIKQGACVMEAVAYVYDLPWSDAPPCTSRVIGAFLRRLNDSMPHAIRQQLLPYVLRVAGTADGDAIERQRAWLCADWAIRTVLPRTCRRIKRDDDAQWLEVLPSLTCRADWMAIADRVHAIHAAYDADAADAAAAAAAAYAAAYDAAAYDAADAAAAAYDAAAYDAADAAAAAAAAAAQARSRGWADLLPSCFALLDAMIALHREDTYTLDPERAAEFGLPELRHTQPLTRYDTPPST